MALDNRGNVYVAGLSEEPGPVPVIDSATVAYDPNGNQLWVAHGPGAGGVDIAVDNKAGRVYVTGSQTVAYDFKGNQLWADSPSIGGSVAIAVDSNTRHVYVTGEGQQSGSIGGSDFVTIAYSQQQDATPPVTTASATPAANGNGWNNTNVTVTLNSTDSESSGTGVKQVQYSLAGAQALSTQTVAGSTASVTISAEGATTLNFLGTDNAGNAEQSQALTVQIDKTPPAISGMPSAGCTLWPPKGQMVTVGTVSAADALSGVAAGSFQVTGSSNEPSDPSKPDVVITPNSSGDYVVQLRAQRLGTGTGRIYTLRATATDLAGNVATSTTSCTVPRDVAP